MSETESRTRSLGQLAGLDLRPPDVGEVACAESVIRLDLTTILGRFLQQQWVRRYLAGLRRAAGEGESTCAKPVIPPDKTMSLDRFVQRQLMPKCLEVPLVSPYVGEAACAGSVIPPDETMTQVESLQQQWRDKCLGALRKPPSVGQVACAKDALSAETKYRVWKLLREDRQPDSKLPSGMDAPKSPVERRMPMEMRERKMWAFWDVYKKRGKTIWFLVKEVLIMVLLVKAALAIFQ